MKLLASVEVRQLARQILDAADDPFAVQPLALRLWEQADAAMHEWRRLDANNHTTAELESVVPGSPLSEIIFQLPSSDLSVVPLTLWRFWWYFHYECYGPTWVEYDDGHDQLHCLCRVFEQPPKRTCRCGAEMQAVS